MHVHGADPVRDDRAGIRIDRCGRNVGVPKIAAGERQKAVETCRLSGGHPVAGEIAATSSPAIPAASTATAAVTAVAGLIGY